MPKDPQAIAQHCLDLWDSLSTELQIWRTNWQDIATYIQPRKASINVNRTYPDASTHAQLFTSTAIRGNQILANGMVSMMTPVESPWFSFDAPASQKTSGPVKEWYGQCSEIIQQLLASSNFYTEVHEMFLDRGGFGTAAMHVETGKKNLFNFTNIGIGTYAIAENDEGYVDSVVREMDKMTVKQAVQKFGIDNVSEKTREKFNDTKNPKKRNDKVCVIHAIYKREDGDYEAGKIGPENMPIASVYIEKEGPHLIQDGGYEEMPTLVTRYLKWGDGFVYGWCPSWFALPDARQLNFLEKMLDAQMEKAAFPSIIAPASMEGVTTLDVRANGVTYVEPDEASVLREWQTTGRADQGLERKQSREQAINEAYHVDLFQMFSNYEGPQITAYEASLKQSEKLIQFSPTNTRLTTEFFNPLLQRIWGMALRAGVLPPPPQEAIQQGQDQQGYIPEPEITYSSRIALAIKSIQTEGFLRTLQILMPLLEFKPEVMDYLNFDEATPDIARNNGTPTSWIYSEDEVQKIRDARAQAMQAQQQMQMQQQAADTLKTAAQAQSETRKAA